MTSSFVIDQNHFYLLPTCPESGSIYAAFSEKQMLNESSEKQMLNESTEKQTLNESYEKQMPNESSGI